VKRTPRSNDRWIRWIILFAAVWIGVAVVRGITFALSGEPGSHGEVVGR
jgi:hypothetical protein